MKNGDNPDGLFEVVFSVGESGLSGLLKKSLRVTDRYFLIASFIFLSKRAMSMFAFARICGDVS